ncbi:1-acylglycerol-3-phosphate O-acyltransferase [Lentibacillus sp. JNUCC-1]|uniref:hypothetical protein n=1 Tax=Lentibacillus sp. JNUCC-1 TaxID=2654513 RepID=UPI001327D7BD|nr:hypothetical protein [Lentibacillus sp. JNUCC-1]MUV38668.1 1-acylglycerol-3-phosphate O-acyltransferase [Lentibacillus sp. JNUCC-1]
MPVAIDGTYQMLEAGNGRVQASHIHIEVKEAVLPEDYQGLNTSQLAKRIQDSIEETLAHHAHPTQETPPAVQVP